MILAQAFSPEEDFYAIFPADVFTNELSDAVDWQKMLPGKQVVKVMGNINFVKWQQHGFKIKLEQEVCKLFSVKAETQETSVKVEVSGLINKVELPSQVEIKLQKEEDGKVTFIVDGVKNNPVEVKSNEVVLCRSNNVEFEVTASDSASLPDVFSVELKSHLAYKFQGIPLV